MPTVGKEIADEIIKGNGYYLDDPIKVIRIVKYQNQFDGGDAYGLIYEGQDWHGYHDSPACINPVEYWKAD